MKPRKIVVKGAPPARRCAIPAGPWTTNLVEDSTGAYRSDGSNRVLADHRRSCLL